jgi:MFS family permease
MTMIVSPAHALYFQPSYGLAADPDGELPRILSKSIASEAKAINDNRTRHLVATILLPFAAGYYLSYVFRTINALISGSLISEFGLSAADLGVLTAVLFLTFAAVQLPLGVWLDRFGPRRVQSVLLSIAAIGSAVFAQADSLIGLTVGRALIGIGVAGALMAGLKALVLWWPAERIALANGWLIMFGGLGAVTATAPAEVLITAIGWRGMFLLLAILSALAALVILQFVPEQLACGRGESFPIGMSIRAVYRDARFWRLAPLSATTIGSAWALQGLWAGPWLADVEGLPRHDVVTHLLVMAIALSVSALILGAVGDQLRRRGVSLSATFAAATGIALVAQIALVLRWPVPAWLPWIPIVGMGAGTVLSYAILSQLFPKCASGRANGALNLLHIGSAFVVQTGFGIIVQLWPGHAEQYPAVAYQTAFSLVIGLQFVGLVWFLLPQSSVPVALGAHVIHRRSNAPSACFSSIIAYDRAAETWMKHLASARLQMQWWRLMAYGAASLAFMLVVMTAQLAMAISMGPIHMVQSPNAVEQRGNTDPANVYVRRPCGHVTWGAVGPAFVVGYGH